MSWWKSRISRFLLVFSLFVLFCFILFCTRDGFRNMPSKIIEKRWFSSDSFPHLGSLFLCSDLILLTQTKTSIQHLDYEKEASAAQSCSQQTSWPSLPRLQACPTNSAWLLHFCPSCSPVHLFHRAPPFFLYWQHILGLLLGFNPSMKFQVSFLALGTQVWTSQYGGGCPSVQIRRLRQGHQTIDILGRG